MSTPTGPAISTATTPPPSGEPGRTTIAESVVAKIAGAATREVRGVYDVGGGAARALGAIRERIPGAGVDVTRGVSVEVGEKQAAVDVRLIVEYGIAIAGLAAAVRRNVIGSVERMTGLQVVAVDISVEDVRLPDDDDGDEPVRPEPASRVV